MNVAFLLSDFCFLIGFTLLTVRSVVFIKRKLGKAHLFWFGKVKNPDKRVKK